MNVRLLSHTPLSQEVCATAAGVCYNAKSPMRALDGAMQGGHLSVLEHASFTFQIDGVSRALLAQLTRHRIASFSVQSQRYVSMADQFEYVIPPSIVALGEYAVNEYKYQMRRMHEWYKEWQQRLGGASETANQDARFVLPNAAATKLVLTMNARELRHFFELRTCNRAQWEIRALADEMLRLCKQTAPVLFEGAGCGCVNGHCPEGRRSCGHPRKESEWEYPHNPVE